MFALPDCQIPLAFALAGMGEAITMAAKKILAWSVQLDDAPPAGNPVHYAGAHEIRPKSAEAAGYTNDADGLLYILPLAAANVHAI